MSDDLLFETSAECVRFFVREFDKESDRACVILGSAMLEQALETLLRARFVRISKKQDPLFDEPYAPLKAFRAKIDIAHRIGLITQDIAKALHLVRATRNDFAHNVTGCTFDYPPVKNRIASLYRSQEEVAERLRPEMQQIFEEWYSVEKEEISAALDTVLTIPRVRVTAQACPSPTTGIKGEPVKAP
jgi:hypothetical protein